MTLNNGIITLSKGSVDLKITQIKSIPDQLSQVRVTGHLIILYQNIHILLHIQNLSEHFANI